MDELSNGDVTRIETVTNLNVHVCLNNLSYKVSKAKKESKELKKIQNG